VWLVVEWDGMARGYRELHLHIDWEGLAWRLAGGSSNRINGLALLHSLFALVGYGIASASLIIPSAQCQGETFSCD
jgi:hypothetical protein